MESSSNKPKDKNKDNECVKTNNIIENIKNKYIFQKIYDNVPKKQKLEIVKYNKKMQNKLNINIKDYKRYCETFTPIEIEIESFSSEGGQFININEYDKIYYHIYFNDNKEEIKNKYEIVPRDEVTKIKIIIDYQIKSFKDLFFKCECIISINFKKFYRNNINNMSYMFSWCSSLEQINFSNFNSDNVNDMSYMFWGCSSLEQINLFNFNTDNVNDMSYMFSECYSLKELNLFNFNTRKVTNMSYMFSGCYNLKELNLFNFNTNNVINMNMMFNKCSYDLVNKMKSEKNKIRKEAFFMYDDNNDNNKFIVTLVIILIIMIIIKKIDY